MTQEEDGDYCAAAAGEPIFTQEDTWKDLRINVQDALRRFEGTTGST